LRVLACDKSLYCAQKALKNTPIVQNAPKSAYSRMHISSSRFGQKRYQLLTPRFALAAQENGASVAAFLPEKIRFPEVVAQA
jgi:hypothetical protein